MSFSYHSCDYLVETNFVIYDLFFECLSLRFIPSFFLGDLFAATLVESKNFHLIVFLNLIDNKAVTGGYVIFLIIEPSKEETHFGFIFLIIHVTGVLFLFL